MPMYLSTAPALWPCVRLDYRTSLGTGENEDEHQEPAGMALSAVSGAITPETADKARRGGGGRITDVIHSDATQLQAWEKLTLNSLGFGVYDIQMIDGHYLTAVGGGGRRHPGMGLDLEPGRVARDFRGRRRLAPAPRHGQSVTQRRPRV
jgi:acyl-CoA hydrolase